MSGWLVWLSDACLLAGAVLCITGGVGLLRMPDFYTRMHAAALTDTLAAPLLLFGLALRMPMSLELVKMLLIGLLVLATNPTATQAMARAALHGGHRPQIDDHTPPTGDR